MRPNTVSGLGLFLEGQQYEMINIDRCSKRGSCCRWSLNKISTKYWTTINTIFLSTKSECDNLAFWEAWKWMEIPTSEISRVVQHKYSKKFPWIFSTKITENQLIITKNAIYYIFLDFPRRNYKINRIELIKQFVRLGKMSAYIFPVWQMSTTVNWISRFLTSVWR